jgi:hypothetical protein
MILNQCAPFPADFYDKAPVGTNPRHVVAEAARRYNVTPGEIRGEWRYPDLMAARREIAGERATVVTARGSRYAFRRRDNGLWGLTMFTAALVAERDKATRDLAVVTAAASDYDRAKR